jgi:hypothetical protein
MNLFKTIVLAGALAVSSTAFAQFAGSGNSSSQATSGNNVATYNRLGVSYTNTTYSPNKKMGGDDVSLNGVSVDYLHGFSVSQTMPLYIEVGVNGNYATGDDDDCDYTSINAQIPVNLAYRFAPSNNFALMPFIGLNFKGGIKLEEETSYNERDFYSEDDMGDDETYNRFQAGWHIGVGGQFNKFYIGLQYGTDFLAAYSKKKKKVDTSDFKLSVAYCF